jgi:serine protease AprX
LAGGVSAADSGKPTATSKTKKAAKVDRDRDRLFDDLEARLADASASDRVSVIVTLDAAASSSRVGALSRRLGGLKVGRRFSVIRGFSATVTKAQAQELARTPGVVRVEENSVVRAFNEGAQSSFGVTKARADAPSLDGDADGNPAVYSANDLVAAVIDTGVHAGHLDLDEGKVIAFKDFVNGRTDAYDDNGHGTHVAATIAGDGDGRTDGLHRGVAPGAGLVGVKVLDANGSGTMANVTAAIDWVVQNKGVYGIEAINLSLGASGCSNGTDATSVAVNNAEAAGLVVAVAAGNDGPGTCTVGTPGAAAGALTVGAMADTAELGFSQAVFSSRGPTADGRIKPDISAPGVRITSAQHGTTSGYVTFDGTSMATPFVAGVALLMRDHSAALTPQQVKNAMTSTAIDWGKTGVDSDHGAGRLDAYASLKVVGAPLTTGPAVPVHQFHDGSLPGSGAYVDYKLGVADTSFPIAATLIHSSVSSARSYSPDFDLYLYDPAGNLVDSAEQITRQEDVAVRPTMTGTYTLRVRSYYGSGPYFVDVSAGIGVDTTAPTVSSTAPADGATGVASTTNVSVTFSEPMNQTATHNAFRLTAPDGTALAGAFSWSGNTLVFNPTADLAAGTRYTASVSTAATDTAGNALAAEKTWSFTTATAPLTKTAFPTSTAIYSGSLRSGGAAQLGANDDAYYQVNSTTSGTRTVDWYGLIPATNSLQKLSVTYRGKSSATCSQRIYIYNWTTSSWVQIDGSRSVGTSEVEVTRSPSGTLADYVSGTSGSGDVAVRVRCTRDGGFYSSADLMRVTYDS